MRDVTFDPNIAEWCDRGLFVPWRDSFASQQPQPTIASRQEHDRHVRDASNRARMPQEASRTPAQHLLAFWRSHV